MTTMLHAQSVDTPEYITRSRRARRPTPAASVWRARYAMGHSASTGLEHDDEPSARATGLQPAVGLRGALWGVDGGHAQGDGT